jgi:hypothetical protein
MPRIFGAQTVVRQKTERLKSIPNGYDSHALLRDMLSVVQAFQNEVLFCLLCYFYGNIIVNYKILQ